MMLVLAANDTLAARWLAGAAGELDYMSAEESSAAVELEAALIADAKAGVDLRVRLIGRACS